MNHFQDKRVVIMGLGLNQGGLGAAKWMLRHGARILVTDLKDQHALAPSIAELERAHILLRKEHGKARIHQPRYVLGQHRLRDFREADIVIRNPGVPRESPYLAAARKAGAAVESDVSLFFHFCPHPVVAVSGTRGKTTTATLAAAMLKRQFGSVVVGGNLRKSVLDSLDALMKKRLAAPIVFELSSWHLETLEFCRKSPHIAALTNVLPDHLNRYRGMKDYAAAKEHIFRFQQADDIAIVPRDDRFTAPMGRRVPSERVWASLRPVPGEANALFYRQGRAVLRRDGDETRLFHERDIRIPGAHNRWNALLAAGLAHLRGARPPAIRAALRAFMGVPHRLERLGAVRGVAYWNDTAATSPDGSIAAMRTLGKKKKNLILIAGGADKNLDFKAWAREAGKHCKEIILFEGAASAKMLPLLKRRSVPVVRTMTAAVLHASRAARRGDIVLLSPGCASFGLFVNEFDRGDQFRAAFKRLPR